MKKQLLAICLLSFSLMACANTQQNTAETTIEPSAVISPVLPQTIDIAGETLQVKRYDIRERLDRELISFSYMHSNTLMIIKRANRFFSEVEPILKEMGVPDDFKYLMAVESNLKQSSVSGVGAAGLWQIMPETAKELGLEVNKDIDERYNIEKATRAACKYLLEAYKKYGNWWTVAASYNAGQGYISKELRNQQADNATDLWLYEETSRYVFRIAALKIIMNNPQKYGFIVKKEDLYPKYEYKEIQVDSTINDLNEWARTQGTTLRHLKEVNLWLRSTRLPDESGKKYTIRILTDKFIKGEC